MRLILFKNKKGQSAVEFLLLIPVLVYVVLIAFQMFSIILTSLINQGAARFELFQRISNHRGYATKIEDNEIKTPLYPSLETFSDSSRATNIEGGVDVTGAPGKPYFAVMVEEPRGSGLYPRREIQTLGTKVIEVKSKVGICERPEGICR